MSRIIRTRRTRPAAENNMPDLLKSISRTELQIAELQLKLAKDKEALFVEMQRKKTTSFGTEFAVAEVVRSAGRETKVIDPAGFRKLVKDDKLFFGAITVGVGAAKKLLPERTLMTITTTIPGKPGEATLKVTLKKDVTLEDLEE